MYFSELILCYVADHNYSWHMEELSSNCPFKRMFTSLVIILFNNISEDHKISVVVRCVFDSRIRMSEARHLLLKCFKGSLTGWITFR